MLLIDDLLKAPGKAMFSLFEQLARKAQQEWLDDESVKQELQQIYALLDGGKISEGEFEAREQKLLERLEQIARVKFQDRWAEKTSTSDSDGPVIEAGLSARSFSDALALPNEQASDGRVGDDVYSPETHAAISEKPSLGANFFQALRPFLDLPKSSADPLAEESAAEASVSQSTNAHTDSIELLSVAAQTNRTAKTINAETILAPENPRPTAHELHRLPSQINRDVRSEPAPTNAAQPVSATHLTDAKTNAPAPATSATISTIGFSGAVESAMQALSVTKLKPSSVISVVSCDDGWQVTVELIERKAVPDTNDLLGVYEVHINKAGIVWRYERTRVRRRNDITR